MDAMPQVFNLPDDRLERNTKGFIKNIENAWDYGRCLCECCIAMQSAISVRDAALRNSLLVEIMNASVKKHAELRSRENIHIVGHADVETRPATAEDLLRDAADSFSLYPEALNHLVH